MKPSFVMLLQRISIRWEACFHWSAVIGSRAANGVVLVTTKGGRLETPARVTVDA